MSDDRPDINKLAVPALVCGVLLLAPFAFVLGVISLVQILKRKQGGLVLALMAIAVSLFVPAALAAVIYGNPRGMDSCIHTQEKAVRALRMIGHLENEHHAKAGRYGSLKDIGWGPKIDLRPYTYEVAYSREGEFLAVARGTGSYAGDELVIDQVQKVRRIVDVCRNRGL